MYTIFKHGKFNRPKKGRCLLKNTHDRYTRKKERKRDQPNKVTEYNKQHSKEKNTKQAHNKESERNKKKTEKKYDQIYV